MRERQLASIPAQIPPVGFCGSKAVPDIPDDQKKNVPALHKAMPPCVKAKRKRLEHSSAHGIGLDLKSGASEKRQLFQSKAEILHTHWRKIIEEGDTK